MIARGPVAAILLLSSISAVSAENVEIDGVRNDFKKCRMISDTSQRVSCYDAIYPKLEPPRFNGALAEETQPFDIDRPTLLRYQSDGAIFVMYLKDAHGNVVQNLHIGGGGESTFLIAKPGTYSLQISGSETWRIWLEPQAATAAHP